MTIRGFRLNNDSSTPKTVCCKALVAILAEVRVVASGARWEIVGPIKENQTEIVAEVQGDDSIRSLGKASQ